MTRALVIVTIVVLAFTVFSTVYAITADKTKVRGLPKWLWILLCLLLPIVGGILYLTVGRPLPDRRATGGYKTKTVAPDDDPDFLRRIRREMEKDKKDKKPKPESNGEPAQDEDPKDPEAPEDNPDDKSK